MTWASKDENMGRWQGGEGQHRKGTEAETEGESVEAASNSSFPAGRAILATSFCLSLASKSPGHREYIPAMLKN